MICRLKKRGVRPPLPKSGGPDPHPLKLRLWSEAPLAVQKALRIQQETPSGALKNIEKLLGGRGRAPDPELGSLHPPAGGEEAGCFIPRSFTSRPL